MPRLFAGKSNEDIEEDVRNILLKGEEEELPAMTSLVWILTIPATVLLLSVLILIISAYVILLVIELQCFPIKV